MAHISEYRYLYFFSVLLLASVWVLPDVMTGPIIGSSGGPGYMPVWVVGVLLIGLFVEFHYLEEVPVVDALLLIAVLTLTTVVGVGAFLLVDAALVGAYTWAAWAAEALLEALLR